MKNLWLVSDTHFGHKNVLGFTGTDGKLIRPQFADVEEMDEHMVENWNSVISDSDHVYHLGDVYFGSSEKADKLLGRLKGKKRLILGNHDDGKDPILHKHFQKILMWRKIPEWNCIMSHVPLHTGSMYTSTHYNIHGHIHEKVIDDPQYINVAVERIDYTPVSIESLNTLS